MRVSVKDVRAAVWAGIGFLNARVPGWRKKINLDKLDLGDGTCCVLGEVYGDYDEGVYRLFGGSHDEAETFGFYLGRFVDPCSEEYNRLTAEWRTAYRAGQRAAAKG